MTLLFAHFCSSRILNLRYLFRVTFVKIPKNTWNFIVNPRKLLHLSWSRDEILTAMGFLARHRENEATGVY